MGAPKGLWEAFLSAIVEVNDKAFTLVDIKERMPSGARPETVASYLSLVTRCGYLRREDRKSVV